MLQVSRCVLWLWLGEALWFIAGLMSRRPTGADLGCFLAVSDRSVFGYWAGCLAGLLYPETESFFVLRSVAERAAGLYCGFVWLTDCQGQSGPHGAWPKTDPVHRSPAGVPGLWYFRRFRLDFYGHQKGVFRPDKQWHAWAVFHQPVSFVLLEHVYSHSCSVRL